jgi:hypothetical protein
LVLPDRFRQAGSDRNGALKRKKPRVSSLKKPQLQRPVKPQPINALNARRDDASCSEGLW